MYCAYCGKELSDDAVFCTYCGKKQTTKEYLHDSSENGRKQTAIDYLRDSSGNEAEEEVSYPAEQFYKPELEQSEKAGGNNSATSKPSKELGLKWYYFIVKIQLWISMVFGLYNGAQYFQGAQYGDNVKAVYTAFPAMSSVDFAFGFLMLVFAVFAFITRRRLVRFEPSGPKFYIGLNIISAFVPIAYALTCSFATNIPFVNLIDENGIVHFVIGMLFALINAIYFKKRKELFSIMRNQATLQRSY